MIKKSKVRQKRRRTISTKKLAIISILIAITILFTVFAISYILSAKNDSFSLNAVIIDQLAKTNPNPSFKENATTLLKARGFNVEYYCNDTINVNFFKSLAERRFGIIILRVHSALRADRSTVDLFTNEIWNGQRYALDLAKELIVYGNYSGDPNYYCAITYRFIESLPGRFPKSVVFAMGCWSLKEGCEELAQAFINKGAKAYIGWTDEILPKDTDAETLNLLETILNDDPLGYAVSKTKSYRYIGMLPNGTQVPITSRLRLYPDSAEVRSLRLSQLINEATMELTQYIVSFFKAAVLVFQTPQTNDKNFGLNKRRFTSLLNV